MQSRYYDPATCRFINADSYASTGQGLLGYNMFAYCLNSPISQNDPTGFCTCMTVPQRQIRNDKICSCGGGGGGEIIFLGLELFSSLFAPPPQIAQQAEKREVYKYSILAKVELQYNSKRSPHVHHIVPVGTFSSRNFTIQQHIKEMHGILADAGINRWMDPVNLVVVSAGTHATLHTDGYIEHVYDYIYAAKGSKEEIYLALFYLRLEIAAMDTYAFGY